MANYSYIAVDAHGGERRGILEVATQMEAVRRVREMVFFRRKLSPAPKPGPSVALNGQRSGQPASVPSS